MGFPARSSSRRGLHEVRRTTWSRIASASITLTIRGRNGNRYRSLRYPSCDRIGTARDMGTGSVQVPHFRYPYRYWFDIGIRTGSISTPQRHRLVPNWRLCYRGRIRWTLCPGNPFPSPLPIRSCAPPTPGNPCRPIPIPLLIESS